MQLIEAHRTGTIQSVHSIVKNNSLVIVTIDGNKFAMQPNSKIRQGDRIIYCINLDMAMKFRPSMNMLPINMLVVNHIKTIK